MRRNGGKRMVINVSGRTDVCAFYSNWFFSRLKEGYFDVRNPFNRKLVSRIYMENVDLILFCTKNPRPVLNRLDEIQKPMVFHVTITPYHSDIEPGLQDKSDVIQCVKELSDKIGKDNVYIRYDPVFLSKKHNLAYHIKAFEKLCTLLDGKVTQILISFLDLYKNTKSHAKELDYKELKEEDFKAIGENFSGISKSHGMNIFTCYEKNNLHQYGFSEGACLSQKKVFELTQKAMPAWKARECGCVKLVDIGDYNCCSHYCKYCYANYDEKSVKSNMEKHDPNSSLLIGHLEPGDIVKERFK